MGDRPEQDDRAPHHQLVPILQQRVVHVRPPREGRIGAGLEVQVHDPVGWTFHPQNLVRGPADGRNVRVDDIHRAGGEPREGRPVVGRFLQQRLQGRIKRLAHGLLAAEVGSFGSAAT
jgi:hypothetical protein